MRACPRACPAKRFGYAVLCPTKCFGHELVGPHGDRLKVRVTAPPVYGKANEHLIRFLAKRFAVAKSQLTLLSGESGRDKRISITNPTQLPPFIVPPLPHKQPL